VRAAAGTARNRRGSVGLSVLLLMLLLDLILVGAVVAGARELDLDRERVDGARAQYAADAAMNIAMREVYTATDEDGDGGVGTVSNDGNEGDDPALGAARFSAARTAGSPSVITASARCGDARRSLAIKAP
jgi:Tfp pilus assembly protein PilX